MKREIETDRFLVKTDTGKEYTIKTDAQARQAAINFAEDVS